MLMSNEQGSKRAAQVDFTRSGWQQFAKLNRKLGARFIRGFILRHELAAYLTAHEAAGTPLDEGCQEVCYENGVYLLLRKMQGVWYITDIFAAEETVAYEPVFFWQKIRPGADFYSGARSEQLAAADGKDGAQHFPWHFIIMDEERTMDDEWILEVMYIMESI